MTRIHDITMPIREAMITYPGNPETRVRPHNRIADGDDANVSVLTFGSHTGTHVDAARHFIEGGQAVDELPLQRLLGRALVVRLPEAVQAIGAAELREAGIDGHTRVLLRTRNSGLLEKTEFDEDFAYLTGDGAEFLLSQGVELVGIDYLSIEAFDAEEPVVHRTLLEREVIVVEGLDLRDIEAGEYELICLPLMVAGIDGAPVRALLREVE
jgi:arylformamidase